MKAPKYAVWTDHMAEHNSDDVMVRLNATNIMDAMAEVLTMNRCDDNLYCTTIFELVAGTKGTTYKAVARNYQNGGFYPADFGWCSFLLNRVVIGDTEYFEL